LFSIHVKKMYWTNEADDDPNDLCLHGKVTVVIGDERLEAECAVSAAALYHLKTLTEDHIVYEENQMLPCCGHSLYPNDAGDEVAISGCPNGVDWTVIHGKKGIELTTESGNTTVVALADYREQVFSFADSVKNFYDKCKSKNVPDDDFERRGYTAFWNEWKRRRNEI